MSVATAMCTTFKQELLQGIHNFQATTTGITGTSNTSTSITAITGTTNIVPGMTITSTAGVAIPAGAVVVSVNYTANSIVISQATASSGATTFTVAGDAFKMALFIASTTGTWGATATNYGTNAGGPTTANIGTDELTTGSGYTAGGTALTNVSPTVNSTGGITNFSPNPSWTTATFSTSGCMVYNTTKGLRTAAIYSFGGTQTVTSGTFTVQMPTAALGTAVIGLA